jgi:hypothetical protein
MSTRETGLLTAGSVIAALGALMYISVGVLQTGTSREDFASPINIAGSIMVTIGIAFILQALARQRALGPSWAVTTASAGLLFTAAIAWFNGTGIVAVANGTTDAQFDDIGVSAWIVIMAAPKMILGLVGFLGLAVTGWRDRSLSRPASILLALGALASLLPPFPPGVLLVSIGLILVARDLRAQSAAVRPQPR